MDPSILAAPQCRAPRGATGWHPPGRRGGCPLPQPTSPWGHPPVHQQERFPSLNLSDPRAQSRPMQTHTHHYGARDAPCPTAFVSELPAGRRQLRGTMGILGGTDAKKTGGGTWRWQEKMGEDAAQSLPSPSQCQWEGKAISSPIPALITAARTPAGGIASPTRCTPSSNGALWHVPPGRKPTPGRAPWAQQHWWHQVRTPEHPGLTSWGVSCWPPAGR